MKKLFLFAGTFLSVIVHGQENTVSGGAEISGVGGHVSQSVGQVFYSSASDNTVAITQGLQQTYIVIEETNLTEHAETASIKVYPNPSADVVVIELEDPDVGLFQFTLTDLSGKILSEKKIEGFKNTVDLKPYANGAYYLKLFLNNMPTRSFKLIKTQ